MMAAMACCPMAQAQTDSLDAPSGTPAAQPVIASAEDLHVTKGMADSAYMNNDFVLYRLADVYYMKAEAILRGGNGSLSTLCADQEFQLIRQRANQPVYTTATLELDELIDERGREFAWEGWRRQDLVRWDRFAKGSWTFKEALSDNTRDLFPIPYDQITKNQTWQQNPGYPQ